MKLFRNRIFRLLLFIAICVCFVLMVEQAWAACGQQPPPCKTSAAPDNTRT